jgi:hypothetical protein
MDSDKLNFISYPKDLFPSIFDKILRGTTMISLITIFQGSLGGMGVIQIPQKIDKFFKNPVMRFIALAAISYTATQDIETALITTVIFLGILHLCRTPEERENVGGFL